VAFRLCCKGVGKPCFGLLEFEPQALAPFLDSLLASLSAFPWVLEPDKVVGLSATVCAVGALLAVHRRGSWSTGVLHDVFEAVKRHGCHEG
jgi:hypothetical protein